MSMTCREAQEEFGALIDGEIDDALRYQVNAHLDSCPECMREFSESVRLMALCRYREEDELLVSDDAVDRVWRSLKDQRHGHSFGARRLLGPLALAAGLAIVLGGIWLFQGSPGERRLEVAVSMPSPPVSPPVQSIPVQIRPDTSVAPATPALTPPTAPEPASNETKHTAEEAGETGKAEEAPEAIEAEWARKEAEARWAEQRAQLEKAAAQEAEKTTRETASDRSLSPQQEPLLSNGKKPVSERPSVSPRQAPLESNQKIVVAENAKATKTKAKSSGDSPPAAKTDSGTKDASLSNKRAENNPGATNVAPMGVRGLPQKSVERIPAPAPAATALRPDDNTTSTTSKDVAQTAPGSLPKEEAPSTVSETPSHLPETPQSTTVETKKEWGPPVPSSGESNSGNVTPVEAEGHPSTSGTQQERQAGPNEEGQEPEKQSKPSEEPSTKSDKEIVLAQKVPTSAPTEKPTATAKGSRAHFSGGFGSLGSVLPMTGVAVTKLGSASKPLEVDPDKVAVKGAGGSSEEKSEPPTKEIEKALDNLTQTTRIGATAFVLRKGVWEQEDYRDQKTRSLEKDSRKFKQILADFPALAHISDLGDGVVFSFKDRWYRLVPKKGTLDPASGDSRAVPIYTYSPPKER